MLVQEVTLVQEGLARLPFLWTSVNEVLISPPGAKGVVTQGAKEGTKFQGAKIMGTSRTAAEQVDLLELDPVEREVLSRLHRGLTNRAICEELGIDADGLKVSIRAVLERLGAQSREQLVTLSQALVEGRSRVA
jgi:DNA-binding NarL/FixJ family response regulator